MIVKFEATQTDRITGKDVIDFIQKHHLEDRTLYRGNADDTLSRVFTIEYDDSEDTSTFIVD